MSDKLKIHNVNIRPLNAQFIKFLPIILLILIIGLGSFLRFFEIGKLSIWLDEALTYFWSLGKLKIPILRDPFMSLYYVLAHFWVRILPTHSEGFLRSLSAVFSILGIPAVFFLGESIAHNKKEGLITGLIAAFLVSVNAYNIQYAQEFRSFSLPFLLSTLSTYFLVKIVDSPESRFKWKILYIVTTVAAIYSFFFSVFIFCAQLISLPVLLLDKKKPIKSFKWVFYCILIVLCLVLPVAYLCFRVKLSDYSWIDKPTIDTIQSFLIDITGKQGRELVLLYLLFCCIGLISGLGVIKYRDLTSKWKFALMTSCFLAPIIVSIIFSILVFPIFVNRYFFLPCRT